MATIEITMDPRELARWTGQTPQLALLRALKKAGADAVRAVRAQAKRGVRERTRIRAGYLADRALPLSYARGQRIEGLIWAVHVSGRQVPLGEYPRRQLRRGVSVEVGRGKRTLLQSAFLARGRGQREAVFLRPSKERYPMGHRLGLSVAQSMADGRVPGAALERGAYVLASAFRRLMPLELEAVR